MNNKEIVADLSLTRAPEVDAAVVQPPIVQAPVVVETPAISHEEYQELSDMRNEQINLQASGYELLEYKEKLDAEVTAVDDRIVSVKDALKASGEKLNVRFTELVTNHGFEGSVTISPTEPHTITQNEG